MVASITTMTLLSAFMLKMVLTGEELENFSDDIVNAVKMLTPTFSPKRRVTETLFPEHIYVKFLGKGSRENLFEGSLSEAINRVRWAGEMQRRFLREKR